MVNKKYQRRLRIRRGIRKKISGTNALPRLCVYKSNTGLYAQLIDDEKGHTIASVSSKELGFKENVNLEKSKSVGQKIAEKATQSGVSKIVFDRSGYKFHGRIKAIADGAREGGLKF